MKENVYRVGGVIVAIVGVLLLANTMGYFELNISPYAAAQTTSGVGSISASSNFGTIQSGMPLSSVVPEKTYKWEVTVENTGDIDWDDGWYTVRLSNSDKDPDISNMRTTRVAEEETAGGKTLVLKAERFGETVKNTIGLREDIRSVWKLKSDDFKSVEHYVATVNVGDLSTGESKTVSFTMTVPPDLKYLGDRILVGNAVAYVGGSYVVDSNEKTVSVGTPEGESSMKFAGAVTLSIIGAALSLGGKFW